MVDEHKLEFILEKYGIHKEDVIGSGMEALVYKYGEHQVLKIYNEMSTISKQVTLKSFYDVLDRTKMDLELPKIHEILNEDGTVVTIEKRIAGQNMKAAMAAASEEKLNKMMENHLNALIKMRILNVEGVFKGIKLFNELDFSQTEGTDWHKFLRDYLVYRLKEVGAYLHKNVTDFHEKIDALLNILAENYTGKYAVIHGDFCPENILVDENGSVTGIIDFGLITMKGDFLFDVATGWVFFDMYDEFKLNLKTRYLNLIKNVLGEEPIGKIFLYALLYSIYSVNYYSHDFNDGHAAWCVQNLNDSKLWNEI